VACATVNHTFPIDDSTLPLFSLFGVACSFFSVFYFALALLAAEPSGLVLSVRLLLSCFFVGVFGSGLSRAFRTSLVTVFLGDDV